jgi:hypothetical protein
MNIFVDFDMTIAGGHSGGFAMRTDPMDSVNKIYIKQKISEWLDKGHNVIIVTRGVDSHIDQYLTKKLNINHTLNDYKLGVLSVYAPTEDEFWQNNDEYKFALIKTKYVSDFLKKSDTLPVNSLFIDDTSINVREMKSRFPDMTNFVAIKGNYQDTVSKIDTWLETKSKKRELGGNRKTRSRKLNNRRKFRYSKK